MKPELRAQWRQLQQRSPNLNLGQFAITTGVPLRLRLASVSQLVNGIFPAIVDVTGGTGIDFAIHHDIIGIQLVIQDFTGFIGECCCGSDNIATGSCVAYATH